jgi:demethylmenaquinone methyltransferase/2-methoxy-6-polyprenyl-1,4-benzoquinol methylase
VYLRTLLPAVGGVISGQRSAYRYLSDTIDSYRSADELQALAEVAGWKGVRYVQMGAGTVGLMSGGSVDR